MDNVEWSDWISEKALVRELRVSKPLLRTLSEAKLIQTRTRKVDAPYKRWDSITDEMIPAFEMVKEYRLYGIDLSKPDVNGQLDELAKMADTARKLLKTDIEDKEERFSSAAAATAKKPTYNKTHGWILNGEDD